VPGALEDAGPLLKNEGRKPWLAVSWAKVACGSIIAIRNVTAQSTGRINPPSLNSIVFEPAIVFDPPGVYSKDDLWTAL
jgi:hypothetical protein